MKSSWETINLTNWQTNQGSRNPTSGTIVASHRTWRHFDTSGDVEYTFVVARGHSFGGTDSEETDNLWRAHLLTDCLPACLHSGTSTPARAVRTTPSLVWPSSELDFSYWQRRTPRFAAAITGDQVAAAASASGLCSCLVYIAQMLRICTMSRGTVSETSCVRKYTPRHSANMPLIKQFQRLHQKTYVELNRS